MTACRDRQRACRGVVSKTDRRRRNTCISRCANRTKQNAIRVAHVEAPGRRWHPVASVANRVVTAARYRDRNCGRTGRGDADAPIAPQSASTRPPRITQSVITTTSPEREISPLTGPFVRISQ